MKELTYVTANPIKFRQAEVVCTPFDIHLEKVELDLQEIQAATGEPIAKHKIEQAYDQLQKPVVISDDSWYIPGLKGFPGPYMKYVNDWLTPNDWLNLTRSLEDRTITLRQIVVFKDAAVEKIFAQDISGILLDEPRGKSPYAQNVIVSFDGGKHSNAEFHEKGESAVRDRNNVWHQFAEWYKDYAE